MEKFRSIMIMAAVAVIATAAMGGTSVLADPDNGTGTYGPGSYLAYDISGTLTSYYLSDTYTYEGSLKCTVVSNTDGGYSVKTVMKLVLKDADGNVVNTSEEEDTVFSPFDQTILDDAVMTGTETISTIDGDVTVNVWEVEEDGALVTCYFSQNCEQCYRIVIVTDFSGGTMMLNLELKEQNLI